MLNLKSTKDPKSERESTLRALSRAGKSQWRVFREEDKTTDSYQNILTKETFEKMPEDLDKFGCLESLVELNVNRNRLADFPLRIGV